MQQSPVDYAGPWVCSVGRIQRSAGCSGGWYWKVRYDGQRKEFQLKVSESGGKKLIVGLTLAHPHLRSGWNEL